MTIGNLPIGDAPIGETPESNGPDLTAIRMEAQALLDRIDALGMLIRSLLLELLSQINIQKSQFNSLLSWLDTQDALIDKAALTSMVQVIEGATGTRADIKARIANMEADS